MTMMPAKVIWQTILLGVQVSMQSIVHAVLHFQSYTCGSRKKKNKKTMKLVHNDTLV